MATYGTPQTICSYSRKDIPHDVWDITPYMSGSEVTADKLVHIKTDDEAQTKFKQMCDSPKNYEQVVLSKRTLVVPS